MQGGQQIDYEATYRRTERVLPGLLGVLAAFAGGMYAVIRYADSRQFETLILSFFGACIFLIVAIALNAFRVHRWTVGPDGVQVRERPKVALTGLPRHATIGFRDIAALRRVESGFDRLFEIATHAGRHYRLPQAVIPRARGLAPADPKGHHDVFSAIRAAAASGGYELPPPSEGLSFWNSAGGLGILVVAFIITLMLAGLVAWALWDGMTLPRARGGAMAAILLLLPVGAGYLLLKSIRRRRDVLRRGAGVTAGAK